MGSERNLYLDAYAIGESKEIETVNTVSSCKNHKDRNCKGFDYCPQCGSKITTWKETKTEYPHIYEILDELEIDEDTFCVAWDESGDGNREILLPNLGEGAIDDYKTLQLEILPDLPDSLIKKFNADYSVELKKLNSATKYVKSCTVKFGIVQYYN